MQVDSLPAELPGKPRGECWDSGNMRVKSGAVLIHLEPRKKDREPGTGCTEKAKPRAQRCSSAHTDSSSAFLCVCGKMALTCTPNLWSPMLGTQTPAPSFDSQVRKICWRRDRLSTPVFLGFPGCSADKQASRNAGDLGSIPGLGRLPGEGNGYALQYSALENSKIV